MKAQEIINHEVEQFVLCLIQKTTKLKEDKALWIKTRLLNKSKIENTEIYEYLKEENSVFKKAYKMNSYMFNVDKYVLYIEFKEDQIVEVRIIFK